MQITKNQKEQFEYSTARPQKRFDSGKLVAEVFDSVKQNGDKALQAYTSFDKVSL